uniref:Uncharacterized protein n=1 Tax=Candidatus Kentrum sp. LPFa TaxID=2126335 RepID=A0A450WXD0_9GAMM|nr:MAG: hypothetical protein BECKLPF1236B_GA0070989_12714 [Candidatus Kentron sp. LPFa]
MVIFALLVRGKASLVGAITAISAGDGNQPLTVRTKAVPPVIVDTTPLAILGDGLATAGNDRQARQGKPHPQQTIAAVAVVGAMARSGCVSVIPGATPGGTSMGMV